MKAYVDLSVQWMATHKEELKIFRGQYVAVHPEMGVVASNKDLVVLHKMLTDSLRDTALADYIPENYP